MKVKALIGMIALGLSGVAFAAGAYFPPERMHCKLNEAGNLSCSDFNRQYLTEATHTADLPAGKELVFNFSSGTAYADENEWVVFFTYKDASGKNIRIKTVSSSISPDLENGSWKAYKDIYTCTTGYMSCPITNLPSHA